MSTPEVRAEHVANDVAPAEPRDDVDAREDVEEVAPRENPETDQGEGETETGRSGDPPHDAPRVDTLATRNELLQRIRGSRKLPKGLRDRLCQFVQTVQLSEDAPVPAVPVAEAVEMVEAAIPEHLQLVGEQMETPVHPLGEGFFSAAGEALSDDDAQRIAAEQLAATGFGPQP